MILMRGILFCGVLAIVFVCASAQDYISGSMVLTALILFAVCDIRKTVKRNAQLKRGSE